MAIAVSSSVGGADESDERSESDVAMLDVLSVRRCRWEVKSDGTRARKRHVGNRAGRPRFGHLEGRLPGSAPELISSVIHRFFFCA